ncbi:MAG: hypothetical protein KDC98_09575 [Planctomycetes bacterium]|nr:hypothetical protein [Planctomycetota bacterium]
MTAPSAAGPTDSWESISAALQDRYPGQRPSVLFCLWKLQQDPAASLRDFRDEAEARDIPIAGRALHSAKVLLGLSEPSTRRKKGPKPAMATAVRKRGAATATDGKGSIEDTLLAAVRRIQTDAGQQAERLRLAVREAITILERALDD